MKRITLAVTLFISLLFSTSVSAHSTLENSSPSDGEIVQEQLTEITMQYNTNIDPMSTFSLTDANGEEVSVETSVNEDVLSGTIGSPLTTGEYTVEWNIIGADGHPITGTYAFTVDLQEVSSDEDNQTVSDNEGTETTNKGTAAENAATDTESTEEGSGTNYTVVGVIVLAAILIITMFTLGRKNRK